MTYFHCDLRCVSHGQFCVRCIQLLYYSGVYCASVRPRVVPYTVYSTVHCNANDSLIIITIGPKNTTHDRDECHHSQRSTRKIVVVQSVQLGKWYMYNVWSLIKQCLMYFYIVNRTDRSTGIIASNRNNDNNNNNKNRKHTQETQEMLMSASDRTAKVINNAGNECR